MITMTIHCPTCNRSSDDVRFVGEFCEVCTLNRIKGRIPQLARIHTCRRCGRVKVAGEYYPIDRKSLAAAIEAGIGQKGCSVKVRHFNGREADTDLTFDVDAAGFTIGKKLRLKDEHETCTRCFRISSGYYQAVVQMRGDPDRVDRFAQRLHKFVERGDGFISKDEAVRNGKDLYVSDKALANEFFSYYELKPKRSYTLFGTKNGKKVYRNIYMVAL